MRIQRTTKYRCEVICADSPYFECIDFPFSNEDLRANHSYEVRLDDDAKNPTIVEKIREIELEEVGEHATEPRERGPHISERLTAKANYALSSFVYLQEFCENSFNAELYLQNLLTGGSDVS